MLPAGFRFPGMTKTECHRDAAAARPRPRHNGRPGGSTGSDACSRARTLADAEAGSSRRSSAAVRTRASRSRIRDRGTRRMTSAATRSSAMRGSPLLLLLGAVCLRAVDRLRECRRTCCSPARSGRQQELADQARARREPAAPGHAGWSRRAWRSRLAGGAAGVADGVAHAAPLLAAGVPNATSVPGLEQIGIDAGVSCSSRLRCGRDFGAACSARSACIGLFRVNRTTGSGGRAAAAR